MTSALRHRIGYALVAIRPLAGLPVLAHRRVPRAGQWHRRRAPRRPAPRRRVRRRRGRGGGLAAGDRADARSRAGGPPPRWARWSWAWPARPVRRARSPAAGMVAPLRHVGRPAGPAPAHEQAGTGCRRRGSPNARAPTTTTTGTGATPSGLGPSATVHGQRSPAPSPAPHPTPRAGPGDPRHAPRRQPSTPLTVTFTGHRGPGRRGLAGVGHGDPRIVPRRGDLPRRRHGLRSHHRGHAHGPHPVAAGRPELRALSGTATGTAAGGGDPTDERRPDPLVGSTAPRLAPPPGPERLLSGITGTTDGPHDSDDHLARWGALPDWPDPGSSTNSSAAACAATAGPGSRSPPSGGRCGGPG